MIVLPRKPSYAMQQLEALVRRLPEQDSDYIYYKEQLHKVRTGFIGEQKVDQMWNEIKLSTEYRMLHNLEFRSLINSFHQIDTLFICEHFILIIETKNIAGQLFFEHNKHQLVRVRNDGEKECFHDPIDQINRHVDGLQFFIPEYVPIEKAIIIANPSTYIAETPGHIAIFHKSGMKSYIDSLLRKYSQKILSLKEIDHIVNSFIKNEKPYKLEIADLDFRIRRGVLCATCNYQSEMYIHYNKWICIHCGTINSEAFFEALRDYRLLINNQITSKQFQLFFGIKTQDYAYQLLRKLNLQTVGKKKNRIYIIPDEL